MVGTAWATQKLRLPRGGGAVFVDVSGQRARLLRRGGRLLTAGAVLLLAALAVAISGLVPPPPWQLPRPQRAHPPIGYHGWAPEPIGGVSSLVSRPAGARPRAGETSSSVPSGSARDPSGQEANPRRLDLGGPTPGTNAEPSGVPAAAPPPTARPRARDRRPPPSSRAVPAETSASPPSGQPTGSEDEAVRGSGGARDAGRTRQNDRAPGHQGSDPAPEDASERGAGARPAGPNRSRQAG